MPSLTGLPAWSITGKKENLNSRLKQRSTCPSPEAISCLMSHSAVAFVLFGLTVSPLGQKYYPI